MLSLSSKLCKFAALSLAAAALALPSLAADTGDYYLSMRNLTTETVPGFIAIKRTAAAPYTTALSGCDGRTYYATSANAATVAAARASGEVVQLHRAEAGQSPQQSVIVCLLDPAGSN